jgi:hypothetical protein
MPAKRTSERRDAPDDFSISSDSQLIPTFDELQEINDDPTVDFENSDAPEDDDDRAGVL